jgi:hypothetical protein
LKIQPQNQAIGAVPPSGRQSLYQSAALYKLSDNCARFCLNLSNSSRLFAPLFLEKVAKYILKLNLVWIPAFAGMTKKQAGMTKKQK